MDEKNDAQAALAKLPLKPGDRFRHFKGGEYDIVCLAVKEDTLEPLVIYHSQTKNSFWARTYENFTETVERDGKRYKRFKRI